MSEFVAEFDVSSCLTEQTYHCRFSHLWNGVGHAPQRFRGHKVSRGWPRGCRGLGAPGVRGNSPNSLAGTFPIAKASYVAAQYLREQLEQEDERPL